MEINLSKSVRDVLEKHDVSVYSKPIQFGSGENASFGVELEWYSSFGEDCVWDIEGINDKDFISNFSKYAKSFDVDDYVDLWAESRGKNGVPATYQDLIDAGNEVQSKLQEIADELNHI